MSQLHSEQHQCQAEEGQAHCTALTSQADRCTTHPKGSSICTPISSMPNMRKAQMPDRMTANLCRWGGTKAYIMEQAGHVASRGVPGSYVSRGT